MLEVPYSLAENEGKLVDDVVKTLFNEPDGNDLGMCVIRAQTPGTGFVYCHNIAMLSSSCI